MNQYIQALNAGYNCGYASTQQQFVHQPHAGGFNPHGSSGPIQGFGVPMQYGYPGYSMTSSGSYIPNGSPFAVAPYQVGPPGLKQEPSPTPGASVASKGSSPSPVTAADGRCGGGAGVGGRPAMPGPYSHQGDIGLRDMISMYLPQQLSGAAGVADAHMVQQAMQAAAHARFFQGHYGQLAHPMPNGAGGGGGTGGDGGPLSNGNFSVK